MVSTQLKNISHIGSFPQVGVKNKKSLSCHHPVLVGAQSTTHLLLKHLRFRKMVESRLIIHENLTLVVELPNPSETYANRQIGAKNSSIFGIFQKMCWVANPPSYHPVTPLVKPGWPGSSPIVSRKSFFAGALNSGWFNLGREGHELGPLTTHGLECTPLAIPNIAMAGISPIFNRVHTSTQSKGENFPACYVWFTRV